MARARGRKPARASFAREGDEQAEAIRGQLLGVWKGTLQDRAPGRDPVGFEHRKRGLPGSPEVGKLAPRRLALRDLPGAAGFDGPQTDRAGEPADRIAAQHRSPDLLEFGARMAAEVPAEADREPGVDTRPIGRAVSTFPEYSRWPLSWRTRSSRAAGQRARCPIEGSSAARMARTASASPPARAPTPTLVCRPRPFDRREIATGASPCRLGIRNVFGSLLARSITQKCDPRRRDAPGSLPGRCMEVPVAPLAYAMNKVSSF